MADGRGRDDPGRVHVSASTRILLVEDSAAYARLVELLLQEALGAAVQTRHAASLGAALEDLAERGAELVLLDLSLPDAHGIDAVERLRTAHPAVPVVVLSGRDEPALAAELDRRGVAFVRKGDEAERLRPAVFRALES